MRKDILKQAAALGVGVDVASPGDGYTRYTFYKPTSSTSYLCRGATEARSFLYGVEAAQVWAASAPKIP